MPVCCDCSGLNVVPMGRRGRFGCVTLLAGAGAFVNAALGLLGWLWCVTFAWNTWARLWTLRLVCWDGCGVCVRLRGIRGRVCERRAWFAGMVVVCVYVCVVCVAFRGL